MGSVPVAEMLASEAQRASPTGHISARPVRVRRPLQQPFPQHIATDRHNIAMCSYVQLDVAMIAL